MACMMNLPVVRSSLTPSVLSANRSRSIVFSVLSAERSGVAAPGDLAVSKKALTFLIY